MQAGINSGVGANNGRRRGAERGVERSAKRGFAGRRGVGGGAAACVLALAAGLSWSGAAMAGGGTILVVPAEMARGELLSEFGVGEGEPAGAARTGRNMDFEPPAVADLVLRVDDDAAPGGDGLSWATAFDSLQAALDAAEDAVVASSGATSVEVRVAGGVYVPGDVDGFGFEVASPVEPVLNLRGGFAGLSGADGDVQDASLYETLLSGDLLGNDPPIGTERDPNAAAFADNAATVLAFAPDATGRTFVERMRIESGFVGMRGLPRRTLEVVFRGHRGAALWAAAERISPGTIVTLEFPDLFLDGVWRLVGCDFEQNLGRSVVGIVASGDSATVVVDRCRFRRNVSLVNYGVTLTSGFTTPSPTLFVTNSLFVGNELTPTLAGESYAGEERAMHGGVHASVFTPLRVVNTLFYGNRAPWSVGATVDSKTLPDSGSQAPRPEDTLIQNSIFWENEGLHGRGPAGAIAILDRYALRGVVVEGWDEPGGWEVSSTFALIEGVSGADPGFVDPVGADGILGTDDDDFRTRSGAPFTDAGFASLPAASQVPGVDAFPATDLRGEPRQVDLVDQGDAVIDLGPFELTAAEADADGNGVVDANDIAADGGLDVDGDGRIDATQAFVDCDGDGVRDSVSIAQGVVDDLDGNGVPDGCQIAAEPGLDGDGNGVLDAAEFRVVYVDDDAAPGGDGTSWGSAFGTLDDALSFAAGRVAATEVRVAAGEYEPAGPDERYATFVLPSLTTVRGGYLATGAEQSTVLRGAGLHVMTVRGEGTVLEDVTVTGGDARGSAAYLYAYLNNGFIVPMLNGEGGGLFAPRGDVVARRVVFEDNDAFVGGHVALVSGEAAFEDCVFGPTASMAGRAAVTARYAVSSQTRSSSMSIESSAISLMSDQDFALLAGAELMLRDVILEAPRLVRMSEFLPKGPTLTLEIENVETTLSVGLLPNKVNLDTTVRVRDSVLRGRAMDSDVLGGGSLAFEMTRTRVERSPVLSEPARLWVGDAATITIRDSLVSGSTSLRADEIWPAVSDVLEVEGSTFVGTTVLWADETRLSNSIFAAVDGSGLSSLVGAATLDARFNVIEGGSTTLADWASLAAAGNNDASAGFVDRLGADGSDGTGDEDYSLRAGSVAVDSGDTSLVSEPGGVDLAGKPRVADDPLTPDAGPTSPAVDRGAFERTGCPGDVTGDGFVNADDLLLVLSVFGAGGGSGGAADVDGDGLVNATDLLTVLGAFGEPC